MPSLWQPGQLLFVGFAGTAAPPPLVEKIAQGRVGGVILFARNIESPEQVLRLCRDLHAAAPADAPLLIAIDQEGGRVQRLR
ncbi:MAG: beta-N-acetylhexosaminidase, partial [Myxococcales bacterium]|nr:beta-N-acetylhexosaminidase [Myxococcales bacterium]